VYVDYFPVDGKRMWTAACKRGLEGIISKRLDLPYRQGRSTQQDECEASVTF
jgi:bifunctional non-homologous end joining protein LigD